LTGRSLIDISRLYRIIITSFAVLMFMPNFPAVPDQAENKWHPPHVLKVWTAKHKGRTFRVIQLPNCEHIEAIISYNPKGETLKQAKERCGGIAACTGSFHNSYSMALADFMQRDGIILSSATTGRGFFAVDSDGRMIISNAYNEIKGKSGIRAIALGQRLAPHLHQDGFSKAFMNKVTDRMALGMNDNFIFIIASKTDIWRLAHFIQNKLPVKRAINCDGGHVVRGKAPVHIVFKWKKDQPKPEFPVTEVFSQEDTLSK